MGKDVITTLKNNFIDMLKSPGVLEDYYSYYSAIVNWVKHNKKYINEDILKKNRLNVLINLDPYIYVIDKPDISLSMEINRFEQIKPNKIDTFAMIIGNTLWDMVTIRTGKDCPNCMYDELRFIIAETITTQEQKLVLECESCGWCQYINGKKCNERCVKDIPANKKDLEKYGVKI